jgi:two-component system, OmpR family, sensor kinase
MRHVLAPLARLPTRVRVTLAFAAVMAVLLTAGGLFLYGRIGATLRATTDRGLRSRADDTAALLRRADRPDGLVAGRASAPDQEGMVQIVTPAGAVADASRGFGGASLLTGAELRRAAQRRIVAEHSTTLFEGGRVRLLAEPVRAHGRTLIVIAGTSLNADAEAQDRLGTVLLLGGPIALLLASIAGYGAAAGALRPVESMRRRAEAIQAGRPGQRLPVPPARDELGRLGATLNAMLGRLEAAVEHERRFVADASHELRTPLTILRGELELASRPGTTDAELRAAVGSAAEETDRLVGLAEDLLVTVRADDGRLPVRRERLALTPELQHVAAAFAARARAAGVDLTVREDDGDGVVACADRARLRQAVGNMVDNALRHGARSVELAAVARDGGAEVHVRDDGDGFPEAFLPAAFERFSRADAARGRGGTGLGLAIVDAIARAHGGRAAARNRAGGGAEVWLALPGEGRA